MKKAAPPKTINDFLAELEAQNKTLSQWARENGVRIDNVYQLLAGRTTGSRGKCREILIAMGVPPPPMFARHTEPRTPSASA